MEGKCVFFIMGPRMTLPVHVMNWLLMKGILFVLTMISMAFFLVSCAMVTGTEKGVKDLSMGTAESVTETTEATGEFLTGHGKEGVESGKTAIESGTAGVKAIVVEPAKGLGETLQDIDAGIKKATGQEEAIK